MSDPGWYHDPGNPGHLRLWDGSAWTDQTRPLLPEPSGERGPASPTAPFADTGAGQPESSRRSARVLGPVAAVVAILLLAAAVTLLVVRSADDPTPDAQMAGEPTPSTNPSTGPASTAGDGPSTTVTSTVTTPAPDPRSMSLERLRNGRLTVPFEPANDVGFTVLTGGVWEGEFVPGVMGRIEMELDEASPQAPIFADLNGDGVVEAIVAIFRQSVPSGRTVVAVVADDTILALLYVDYTGPVREIPIRSGLRSMKLVDGEIELQVTPNFVQDDPRLETQRFALRGNQLQRVG